MILSGERFGILEPREEIFVIEGQVSPGMECTIGELQGCRDQFLPFEKVTRVFFCSYEKAHFIAYLLSEKIQYLNLFGIKSPALLESQILYTVLSPFRKKSGLTFFGFVYAEIDKILRHIIFREMAPSC
jgi:hypothetical protein